MKAIVVHANGYEIEYTFADEGELAEMAMETPLPILIRMLEKIAIEMNLNPENIDEANERATEVFARILGPI